MDSDVGATDRGLLVGGMMRSGWQGVFNGMMLYRSRMGSESKWWHDARPTPLQICTHLTLSANIPIRAITKASTHYANSIYRMLAVGRPIFKEAPVPCKACLRTDHNQHIDHHLCEEVSVDMSCTRCTRHL